jgi:hypothetical protein
MPTSLTTAFTIIGSLAAASTAQIVSHILTKKREDKKDKKEAFQNLYSPTVFKVMDYIQTEGINNNPLFAEKDEEEFEDTDLIFKGIMKQIGSNLKYAEVDLISAYNDVLSIETVDTPNFSAAKASKNMNIITERMILANIFLSRYMKISKELKLENRSILERFETPYFFSHFYLLVTECFYLTDPKGWEIFELYHMIETNLIPDNNYLERIIEIRDKLHIAQFHTTKSNDPSVEDAYSSAYSLFYEFVDDFAYLSEERAEDWKEMIDENHHFWFQR